MKPKEVSKNLREVQEKYKNVVTFTGSIRVSDMAKEAADAIDSLQEFVDFIGTLPTCNECYNKQCGYIAPLGRPVRYNCPLYRGISDGPN